MSEPVIKVDGLGKKYVLARGGPGAPQGNYKRFSDVLLDAARAPLRMLGAGRSKHSQREDFWALRDVSFEVQRGEMVGIIGRNGAGKSTLLKILSRVTEPTTGCIELDGRVASLLEVGTGFHPELTGRENIFLNGAILGMTRAEIRRKFDEIVAFAEVDQFLDTPVKRYSSGMYVRLAFAVAAHLEPEILVVDEVLAVGDAQFQKKCLGKMQDVSRQQGRTVLFVSHNLGAISALCPRSIVLEQGRVKSIGPTAAAIAAYLSPSTDHTSDLRQHPHRGAGFRPLLTSFNYTTTDGVIRHGSSIRFEIGYDFPEAVIQPQFCILVSTIEGTRAFTLISSYQTNRVPATLRGAGTVVCETDGLPLMPGHYTIALKLWIPGQQLDGLESVASFTVEMLGNESFGQFQWDASLGVAYVGAQWQVAG